MKQTFYLAILIAILICSFTSTTSMNSGINMSTSTLSKKIDVKLPKNVKVFFQSWVKYFSTRKMNMKPKTFFKNNKYYSQWYSVVQAKKADKYGPKVIPSDSQFFLVAYRSRVNVYFGRDNILENSADSFEVAHIQAVPEDRFLKGGVRNRGKYFPGFCIDVLLSVPKGGDKKSVSKWIICLDTRKQKAKLLKILIKLKINEQRDRDQIITMEALKKKGENHDDEDEIKQNKGLNDGKLVMLQDWTDCTLKCGGGESFQQWMCIPPKNGGKPCKGQLLRKRKCNKDKCPSPQQEEEIAKQEKPKFRTPTVRVERFSQRYNRFRKCVIKESDIFRYNNTNKLPARIIMNNSTVTIYGDDNYDNLVHSFVLKKTAFTTQGFCCFKLSDGPTAIKLCGFDAMCGPPNKNKFVDEWTKDFQTFKDTCRVGKQTLLLTDEDEANINKQMKRKQASSMIDIEEKKLVKTKENMGIKNERKLRKKIRKTQKVGVKAVEKELMIENLIKTDQEQMEAGKERQILLKIANEKSKAKLFNNQIKEKELDEVFRADQFAAEGELTTTRQEIVQQIKINRKALKKTLDKIKIQAKLRRAALKGKLKLMKQKIAKKMMTATKNGNQDNCKKGNIDDNFRESYCNKAYREDYVENQSCKNKESYCYSCCDAEFGTLRPNLRDNCLTMCDEEKDKDSNAARKKNEKENAKKKPEHMWRWLAKKDK